MKKDIEARRARVMRRARAAAFLKRNGVYIAVVLCLAMIGGLLALLPAGKNPKKGSEEPAAHSLDERLSEALATVPPSKAPERTPYVMRPENTSAPTASPTLMPELTPAPSSEPAPTSASKYNSPADGKLIKPYSMDALIYSKTLKQWMTHSGVDIAAPKGSEVRSIAAGTVEKVYDDDMLGTTIVIDHGGIKSVYSGLKKEVCVKEGDTVETRALIGYIGDTAISECADESHLHFEIWKNGSPIDPESMVLIAKKG